MASTKDYAQYVTDDLMAGIDGVSSRAMFGGFGIYRDGVVFAIIVENQLYFKVDETNQKKYEKMKSKPFTYAMKKGKEYSMPYWIVPDEIQESPKVLKAWVEESVEISKKKKKAKAAPKKKK